MKKHMIHLIIFFLIVMIISNIVINGKTFATSNSFKNDLERYQRDEYDYEELWGDECDTEYGTGITAQNLMTSLLIFIELAGVIIPILIIIISVSINCKVKKQIRINENNLERTDDLNKRKELETIILGLKNKEKTLKKTYIILIFIVILFFLCSGILGTMKKFAKPIIYIYPQEEQVVTVRLERDDLITCSYPRYEGEWKVLAKPNGDLINLKTGKKLYALYWEARNFNKQNYKEGFMVKGEDSAKFLEEKLEILGLNEREAEEFIIYWLPKMEKNNYNYIHFIPQKDIDKQMPIEINPNPDTLIRVYMQFKGLTKPMKNVKEQNLEKIERKGFVVVEWGGTEI